MPDEIDQHAHDAVRGLRSALDRVGDALAGANLDDLLAAEELLARAVAEAHDQLGTAGQVHDAERLRREVLNLRAALQRCRRLGLSLGEFAMFSLTSQGATSGYTRQGETKALLSGSAVDARA